MAFQIVKIPDLPVASEVTAGTQYPVETPSGTARATQAVIDTYSNSKFIRKNVNDTTTGVITAAGFTSTSTKKYKEDIKVLGSEVVDKLLALIPVTYKFKADSPVKPGQSDIGLVAEDVRQFLPELVSENENGDLGVDYSKLAVYLLKAVIDLSARVEELEQK